MGKWVAGSAGLSTETEGGLGADLNVGLTFQGDPSRARGFEKGIGTFLWKESFPSHSILITSNKKGERGKKKKRKKVPE